MTKDSSQQSLEQSEVGLSLEDLIRRGGRGVNGGVKVGHRVEQNQGT
jgi:hypothetical protein